MHWYVFICLGGGGGRSSPIVVKEAGEIAVVFLVMCVLPGVGFALRAAQSQLGNLPVRPVLAVEQDGA